MSLPNVKIFVCYHKPSRIFSNEVLQPVLVGATNTKEEIVKRLEQLCKNAHTALLRDDNGENISSLNPYFCELTAMYWAWKNINADYYGIFHYRRVFNMVSVCGGGGKHTTI